jgi:hypothetical protein
MARLGVSPLWLLLPPPPSLSAASMSRYTAPKETVPRYGGVGSAAQILASCRCDARLLGTQSLDHASILFTGTILSVPPSPLLCSDSSPRSRLINDCESSRIPPLFL